MKKRSRTVSRKQLVIIGSVAAILAILGAYVTLSVQQWQLVQADTDKSAQEFARDTKRVFADTTDSRERYIVVERLADTTPDHSCNVGWWGDWEASLFTAARKTKGSCQKAADKRKEVRQYAKRAVEFLDDQTAIQTVLVKLSFGKSPITEGDFAKHAAAVAEVDKELKAMSVSQAARPLLESAQKAVTGVGTAWDNLQKANKAEERARYEATAGALDQAYLQLSGVSKQATESYALLLTDLKAHI